MKRLISLVAATAFAGPALAHSDEAVADAEALLQATIARAGQREANAQEVLFARYHLLEMKLAAGKLSSDAFCAEAQAELKNMATADGYEPIKAEIGLRADKIGAMTSSAEACRQAVEDVDAYLFGLEPPAKTDDEVKQAERAAHDARSRYKSGDLDRTNATLAEIAGLEAPYTAGKITREAYCASGQGALLADFVNWMQTLAQFGQAGLLAQISARRRLYQFKALCGQK